MLQTSPRLFIKRLLSSKSFVAIVYYHRVASVVADPQKLTVSPDNFFDQVAWLSKHCKPLSLDDLVSTIRSGHNVPKYGVVVTFDDGYADNLHNALPILEEFGIPATFFVATDNIGTDREFWWDEIERVLLSSKEIPGILKLNFSGQDISFRTATMTERERFYQTLLQLAKPLSANMRGRLLESLIDWAGVGYTGRTSHRVMTIEELQMLDKNPLVTIGAHTSSHPMLAALAPDEQRNEISEGKRKLENILGHEIKFLSYPFGQRQDYNHDSIAICRELGFSCACTTKRGIIRTGYSEDMLFELPRFCVRDWPIEEFKEMINNWFINQ